MGKLHTEELKALSLSRILGFSCQRLWMALMFYSIIPYVFSADIRSTLYQHQTISLFAFAIGCIFIIALHKPHTRMRKADLLLWGSAVLTTAGTVLCFLADVTTPAGMLVTTVTGIATGIGSSIVFVLWMRLFYSKGPVVTLVEYAAGSVVGLTASLLLVFAPQAVTMAVVALSPLGSTAGLAHHAFTKKTDRAPHRENKPLSRSAIRLFVRALSGAFLLGFLQGLTDIISGFTAFSTTDEHGVYLFLAGILVSLFVACVGIVKTDPLDTLYRVSMLLLGFGFVLMAFMREYYTFFEAISFGGYMIFIAFILVASGRISASFETGIMRPAAASIGALYLGEAGGLVLGGGLTTVFGNSLHAGYISAICVFVFLLVHLFLFNETDLVHAGIGDIDLVEGAALPAQTACEACEKCPKIEVAAGESGQEAPGGAAGTATSTTTAAPSPSPSDVFQDRARALTQQYGLSPREAEVLSLILQGRTMARIQEELFISAGTVSTHMRHIYQKAGVANKQQLLDLAFPKG